MLDGQDGWIAARLHALCRASFSILLHEGGRPHFGWLCADYKVPVSWSI
jgi:hypothetical protein